MKKIVSLIVLSVMLVMVIVPVAFADNKLQQIDREERILKVHERNTKLFTNYNSIDLETYLNLFDEHENTHQSIDAIKEELKTLRDDTNGFTREEAKIYREELINKVKSGEITREEARVLFEEFTGLTKEELDLRKDEYILEREQLDSINESLKENSELRIIVNKNIYENLLMNNDDLVKENLVELLSLQQSHLELDIQKLEIWQDILNDYNN
ncbi:MAG: hypothetical protein U9N10_04840 [Bacillota bacterium]|nr:hypothetical protein [Bacillota bacterium]